MAGAVVLTRVRTRKSTSSQMHNSPPTVLHVIPGLHTGGAEHRLAALVTAKRKQLFSQVIVDLRGSTASDSTLTDGIRAAGIPVHQFGGHMTLDLPIILLRLCGLIRQVRPVAIQSW